jgi:hypothetical protein
MDGHLGRIRPRDEVGRSDQVKKMLVRHPFPVGHHLVMHHGNMSGRPAKSGETQAQKQANHLMQCLLLRIHIRLICWIRIWNERKIKAVWGKKLLCSRRWAVTQTLGYGRMGGRLAHGIPVSTG